MADLTEPEGNASLPPAPRRHATHDRPAANPPPKFANFAHHLKNLADQLDEAGGDDAEEEADRPARRHMRFQRKTAPDAARGGSPASPTLDEPDDTQEPPPGEEPASAAEPETAPGDPADPPANLAWPRLSREERPAASPAARAKNKRRSATGPLFLMMACNLGMLAFGYWLGQSAVSPATSADATGGKSSSAAVPAPPGGEAGSDKGLEAANAALKVELTDPKAASRLYENAVEEKIGLPGAEYRLALLALQRGDLTAADLHLTHSTAAGECVGPCHFVWATLAGHDGNFAEASRHLEAALRAEPFSARYCFYLGEALRRAGKPRAAEDNFEQALARDHDAGEGELYTFKLGLAKLETGNDAEFGAAIAAHLREPAPGGDWWLLAAAQALSHGDYRTASDQLQAAARVLPPARFASRVRDYLFQMHADKALVVRYLAPPAPAAAATPGAGPTLADPDRWPAEEADPGTWPVAGAGAGQAVHLH